MTVFNLIILVLAGAMAAIVMFSFRPSIASTIQISQEQSGSLYAQNDVVTLQKLLRIEHEGNLRLLRAGLRMEESLAKIEAGICIVLFVNAVAFFRAARSLKRFQSQAKPIS